MAARALPGSEAVSTNSSWIFLPRTPPEALISSTASDDPFFQLLPTVAPAPESSIMLGILIVSCAHAAWAVTSPEANVAKVTRVVQRIIGSPCAFLLAPVFSRHSGAGAFDGRRDLAGRQGCGQ